MQLADEVRIAAPREVVYAALNDPDVLRAAIPGCESLEQKSETELAATVALKIGPIKARFSGEVTLSNLNPPESYTITGEGSGGVAGFAKGGGDVALEADGDETVMKYDVTADVGGKIAQLGNRLLNGTAKRLTREFFDTFGEIVARRHAGEEIEAGDGGDSGDGGGDGGDGG